MDSWKISFEIIYKYKSCPLVEKGSTWDEIVIEKWVVEKIFLAWYK